MIQFVEAKIFVDPEGYWAIALDGVVQCRVRSPEEARDLFKEHILPLLASRNK